MGVYTGTVPTLLNGEYADATKLVEITNFMTAATAAWTAFTPTWAATGSAVALGNGTNVGWYRQLGKKVEFYGKTSFGSTTTFGTINYQWALPVAALRGSDQVIASACQLIDSSPSTFRPGVIVIPASLTVFYITSNSGITGTTLPWTWATGDSVSFAGSYEAA